MGIKDDKFQNYRKFNNIIENLMAGTNSVLKCKFQEPHLETIGTKKDKLRNYGCVWFAKK